MAGPIAASAFNRLGQYASSPDNRAYCYAELAVSSLEVAETIVSTHCASRLNRPDRVAWLNTKIPANGHPSQY